MSQLFYLSGTSENRARLTRWLAQRPDAGGVLLVTEDEKVFLREIGSDRKILLSAGPKEKRTYALGPEIRSVMAYEAASDLITEIPENPSVKWLVIDGIGPLELRKEGLHLLLQNMALRVLPGVNVVLIVAPETLEKIRKRYQLQGRAQEFEF